MGIPSFAFSSHLLARTQEGRLGVRKPRDGVAGRYFLAALPVHAVTPWEESTAVLH